MGIIDFLASMLYFLFATLSYYGGPGGTIHFTVPTALVSQLSSDNQTFEGKDTADFLSDFVVVSNKESNGKKSFTFTKKGVAAVMVSCTGAGQCNAVTKALR